MTNVFQHHERSFAMNRAVYPVVSRRSRGVSIGVDVCPGVCTFRCAYCSEIGPGEAKEGRKEADLDVLERELSGMLRLIQSGKIFEIPPFDETPAHFRRLNDIAFSGSGEPTLCPNFSEVCARVHALCERAQRGGLWETPKVVLITNATSLHLPHVREGLDELGDMLEVWAKLDAGTENLFRAVNRSRVPFERVLGNLRETGRARPIFIQTMAGRFTQADGPAALTLLDAQESSAWLAALRSLAADGAQIQGVQLYTVARAPRGGTFFPALDDELSRLAGRVLAETGIPAAWFGGTGTMGSAGKGGAE